MQLNIDKFGIDVVDKTKREIEKVLVGVTVNMHIFKVTILILLSNNLFY